MTLKILTMGLRDRSNQLYLFLIMEASTKFLRWQLEGTDNCLFSGDELLNISFFKQEDSLRMRQA